MDTDNFVDADGWPGTRQADGSYDGGDTAAIVGTIRALDPFDLMGFALPEELLMDYPTGNPIRHPDPTKWYSHPDRFSRDQLVATLCGNIAVGSHPDWLYTAHAKRYFLTTWNTKGNGAIDMPDKFPDVCGPEVWALWLRACAPRFITPLLTVLDLETLVNSLIWRFWRKDNVCRNHMLVCLITQEHYPTVTSRLAYRILNWTDLLQRWENHCKIVGEYPTGWLFRGAQARVEEMKRG